MPRNLLLADDSITIQKVVGITLAGEDFTIVAVDNGEDAIRKAKESPPDIVLADVVMPKKNGYEVCEAVKNDPELAHIPVLLLAGTFEAFDEARARSVRADGHIAKPFESQALVNKVRELIEPRAASSADAAEARHAPAPSVASTPAANAPSAPSRTIVPPVLVRPPPPLATVPKPVERESWPARSATDRGAGGELDWAALGFEAEAAARGASDEHSGPAQSAPAGVTATAPSRSPAPVPTATPNLAPTPTSPGAAPPPTRAAVARTIPPAPTPVPPQPSAPPQTFAPAAQTVAAPAAPTRAKTDAGSPPELLPFGEPIDLAELEVEEPEFEAVPEGSTESRAQEHSGVGSPISEAVAKVDGGEALLRTALSQASREVIERIAWEIIPTLAETIIREQVERLVKAREKQAG